MAESSSDGDHEFAAPLNGVRSLVLVGWEGNGKSATGNSILGKKGFLSMISPVIVTTTSELRTTVLKDGQILNVIDTPGFVGSYTENVGKEIVKCINMAKEGIHAVLVVLSGRGQFSKREEVAIRSFSTWFGDNINDYMIVVVTEGDLFEHHGQTLEGYFKDCPVPLKETLSLRGDRCVLFNNSTEDEKKRANQLDELLSLVNMVLTKNNGKPYTDKIFSELKRATTKLHEQTEEIQSSHKYSKQEKSELTEKVHKSYEERLKRITEMVEFRVKETTFTLEQQFAEEQIATLKAYVAHVKSNDEIPNVKENLEQTQKEIKDI